jgi:membrane fusion protein, multidrug efflux system
MRNWKIALAGTGLVTTIVAVIVLWQGDLVTGGRAGAATPSPAAPPMPVPVTKIVKKDLPIYLDYSARTESIRSIALQAKVPGYIRQQHVSDGTDVQEGDLLYSIDPRDLQAALDQAKAPGPAGPGGCRLCALESQARIHSRQERLARL